MTQHHDSAEQQGGRVGQVHASDVRGGAVDLQVNKQAEDTCRQEPRDWTRSVKQTNRFKDGDPVGADVSTRSDAESSDEPGTEITETRRDETLDEDPTPDGTDSDRH